MISIRVYLCTLRYYAMYAYIEHNSVYNLLRNITLSANYLLELSVRHVTYWWPMSDFSIIGTWSKPHDCFNTLQFESLHNYLIELVI